MRFFRGVVAVLASSLPTEAIAASYSARLSAFTGCGRRVPSVPGRPLNFCQSPVTLSSACTDSVGCAPTESQYCARSESTSMTLGSAFGWYSPMFSMARPLRRVRASATTMR